MNSNPYILCHPLMSLRHHQGRNLGLDLDCGACPFFKGRVAMQSYPLERMHRRSPHITQLDMPARSLGLGPYAILGYANEFFWTFLGASHALGGQNRAWKARLFGDGSLSMRVPLGYPFVSIYPSSCPQLEYSHMVSVLLSLPHACRPCLGSRTWLFTILRHSFTFRYLPQGWLSTLSRVCIPKPQGVSQSLHDKLHALAHIREIAINPVYILCPLRSSTIVNCSRSTFLIL